MNDPLEPRDEILFAMLSLICTKLGITAEAINAVLAEYQAQKAKQEAPDAR